MKNKNFNREGYPSGLTGYVTQLDQITEKNGTDLALALGYTAGALAEGYALYFLIQQVGMADFRWKDRSRYSGGMALELVEYRSGGKIVSEYMYVDRYDQMRYARNQQASLPQEWEVDDFMCMQQQLLNVRSGSRRIAKVKPLTELGKSDFPDAPGHGVPQWEIVVEKQFICAAVVGPGQTVRAGVFNASHNR